MPSRYPGLLDGPAHQDMGQLLSSLTPCLSRSNASVTSIDPLDAIMQNSQAAPWHCSPQPLVSKKCMLRHAYPANLKKALQSLLLWDRPRASV